MIKDEVTVSVITCLYNGNGYIEKLCQMFECNVKMFPEKYSFEYILINDSPWNTVIIPDKYKYLPIRVCNNATNVGIHESRVNGIRTAKGKYVLILDQDDEIQDNFLYSQLSQIGSGDVIVCNGYKETSLSSNIIYKDRIKQGLINCKNAYLLAANQIVSPGQCLIKKSSIPKPWLKYVMKSNGSDDLFLWLLYLYLGKRFVVNNSTLYCHKQVGRNLSNDLKKMCESDKEMCDIALKYHLLPENAIKKRLRMTKFISFTNYTQKVSLKSLIRFPDVLLFKAFSKIV